MADEKPAEGTPDSGDDLKNIKSEFARKTSNLEKMLADQNARSEQMMQAMIQMQQQRAANKQDSAVSQDDLDEIGVDPIDNPKEFAKRVLKQATANALKATDARATENSRANNEQQSTLLSLAAEYPELNDPNSDIYKSALEISKNMPDQYRSTSVGLKAAVREAAANLGVLPVNKRDKKSNSDDFSVDSGSGEGRKSRDSKKESDGDIDPTARAFAELLGRPVKDPKFIERLKEASKRKDWKRYK